MSPALRMEKVISIASRPAVVDLHPGHHQAWQVQFEQLGAIYSTAPETSSCDVPKSVFGM